MLRLILLLTGLTLSAACLAQPARLLGPGDQHRTLELEGRQVPYRVFVPPNLEAAQLAPLLVVFPGGRGDENEAFDRAPEPLRDQLATLAARHRMVVLGLNPMGSNFGAEFAFPEGMKPPPERAPPRDADHSAFSERAAVRVIDEVIRIAAIDPRRVYLTGNSRGEVVSVYFATRYPGRWCAIAPTSGPFVAPGWAWGNLQRLSGAIFFHGDADTLALLEPNRAVAEKVRGTGVPTEFHVVPGGQHNTTWFLALPRILAFFDQHACSR